MTLLLCVLESFFPLSQTLSKEGTTKKRDKDTKSGGGARRGIDNCRSPAIVKRWPQWMEAAVCRKHNSENFSYPAKAEMQGQREGEGENGET